MSLSSCSSLNGNNQVLCLEEHFWPSLNHFPGNLPLVSHSVPWGVSFLLRVLTAYTCPRLRLSVLNHNYLTLLKALLLLCTVLQEAD